MGLFSPLRGATVQERQMLIAAGAIKEYFLKKPEVFQAGLGELRIGKKGRGRVEIAELTDCYPKRDASLRVTIYDNYSHAEVESYDHIHQALEWCLGADVYSTFRQLFDPDTGALSVILNAEKDLDNLYALAIAYFNILDDEQCVSMESHLQNLRARLRNQVNRHIAILR